METHDYVWGGLILTAAAFEAYALYGSKPGDTFSEVTRRVFRVHSRTGKIVFAGAWGSFAVWFMGHILWGWPFPGV